MKLNKDVLKFNPKEVSEKIQKFIKAIIKDLKRDGIIFGLSGGVDSATTATLCVKALGRDKIIGLLMPEKEGSPEATKDGKIVAHRLGIKTKLIDITPYLESMGLYNYIFSKTPTRKLKEKATRLIYRQLERKYGESPFACGLKGVGNKLVAKDFAHFKAKHRMRMVLVYYYGESNNLLVVGAANKSEGITGLFCKFGIDNNADIMPLGNLYRTQILQLANYLNVPKAIIEKLSSPDIIPGISDKYTYVTGLSSEKVDLILFGLEKKLSLVKIAKELNITTLKVNYIKSLKEKSFHMLHPSMAPVV